MKASDLFVNNSKFLVGKNSLFIAIVDLSIVFSTFFLLKNSDLFTHFFLHFRKHLSSSFFQFFQTWNMFALLDSNHFKRETYKTEPITLRVIARICFNLIFEYTCRT